MTSKEYFDYIVNIPLEEELSEFLKVFEFSEDLTADFSLRFRVKAENSASKILVVQQTEMGKTAAQRAISSALQKYDAGIVVCLGIAGTLTDDLILATFVTPAPSLTYLTTRKLQRDQRARNERWRRPFIIRRLS